jgi:predicted ATPase
MLLRRRLGIVGRRPERRPGIFDNLVEACHDSFGYTFCPAVIPTGESEKKMYSAISIENFRCFSSLSLEGLKRINLFVGKNNAGKTAVLESLFFMLGPTNPDLALKVNVFRGVEQFKTDADDLWGWLFHDKAMNSTIRFSVSAPGIHRRRLEIKLGEPQVARVGTKKNGKHKNRVASATTDSPLSQLILTYHDENNRKLVSTASIHDSAIHINRTKAAVKFPTSIFVTARAGYVADNAERFSRLQEVGKDDELIVPLQLIEPRLKKLAVLIKGSGPVLHADVGMKHMVPLTMMGEGIGRLTTLLLAILTSERGGAAILDEVETGLHYSVMKTVWDAIAQTARQRDVQLFTSTHSWECLKAARESFSASEQKDFAVYRLDRKDGEASASRFDVEMLDVAMESGLEVR